MARIRTIKPEFPQSESMGRVSRDARLCFVQMWTLADDEGRLRGNSRMLASLLFPYDNDAPDLIDSWLDELDAEGCIQRYVADGSTYIQIAKWLSHQKIDRPSQSKIPPFDESSRILANARDWIKDQGPRTKEPGACVSPPAQKPIREPKATGEPDGFKTFWETWPSSDRKGGRSKCLESWLKGKCEQVSPEILRHVEHMKQSPDWLKEGGRFIPGPQVYLNQRRWEGAETQPVSLGLKVVGGV